MTCTHGRLQGSCEDCAYDAAKAAGHPPSGPPPAEVRRLTEPPAPEPPTKTRRR
ncbi:MAG TPA: hypothetical protein VN520_21215 [Streptomyces sp.]|uniref:hypothetical protein n=1 Tax=Streptomyces sp. TaxID=1931 RepID=UPI002C560AD8|nr:hypothetical protein [Streptomyces sp.]HWU08869.1 hypothetical protein [Streptomyces sp.]